MLLGSGLTGSQVALVSSRANRASHAKAAIRASTTLDPPRPRLSCRPRPQGLVYSDPGSTAVEIGPAQLNSRPGKLKLSSAMPMIVTNRANRATFS